MRPKTFKILSSGQFLRAKCPLMMVKGWTLRIYQCPLKPSIPLHILDVYLRHGSNITVKIVFGFKENASIAFSSPIKLEVPHVWLVTKLATQAPGWGARKAPRTATCSARATTQLSLLPSTRSNRATRKRYFEGKFGTPKKDEHSKTWTRQRPHRNQ